MAQVGGARAAGLLAVIALFSGTLLVRCTTDEILSPHVAPPGSDAADTGAAETGGPEAGRDAGEERREAAPDAAEEQQPDAPDDSSQVGESSAVDVVILQAPDPTVPLTAQSPSCLQCATDNCSNYIDGCAAVAGVADQGPAAGTPRSALCVETLSCLFSTGCASCLDPTTGCSPLTKFGTCYCRWDDPFVQKVPAFCEPPLANFSGPCRQELERSFETTDTWSLLSSFSDTSKGGGWAMQLMQCLVDNRCGSCYPPPVDAAADALDAPAAPADAAAAR